MMYFVIAGVFALIGGMVSSRLKNKFAHYSKVPMTGRLSGYDVARKMMADYGISDVRIVQGQGFLSDHYNPQTKTVSLSPDVYQGRSVAAAVAAHECGHVVQHATAYSWLPLRSKLVPVVQLASRAQGPLFLLAFGGFAYGAGGDLLVQIAILAFLITTLFALVTLPVEFDASKRALAWLKESRLTNGQQQAGAKDALWWAAMTYVVSALSSITVLLYLILSTQRRR